MLHIRKFNVLRPVLLLMLFFILTACQAPGIHQNYSGPLKASSEISTFTIPEEFNLLYIDGEAYKTGFNIGDTVLHVLPGAHQFVLEYMVFWEPPMDARERIESQPFIVGFTAIAGNNFKIDYKELVEIDDARAFVENPKVSVMNITTQKPAPTQTKYNLNDKSYVVDFIKANFSAANPQAASLKSADAYEELKRWWETADMTQQENFLQWIEQ